MALEAGSRARSMFGPNPVDLNIRAVVEITLCFLPAIRVARGKVLNVASVAAYFPGGPGMAAYYASKSFILSFSLARSQELHSHGVAVSALCPGYTKTDFQARAADFRRENIVLRGDADMGRAMRKSSDGRVTRLYPSGKSGSGACRGSETRPSHNA
ncbi:MAG: SDR family NAD(P)-dependent oxidoreductase [Methylocella sp.]|nr:MAG: hypothetical protein DLM68_07990 [Hyphomicrobiales bacterium]